ncbi:hypothetical protein [Spongiimicrobium sp. 3-5]|uniref:hypothetical protein n=1 Tax=Spongiimicrobium sp. 3-5 TaxID=3332596 RepID=UPI00397FACCF
MNLPSAYGSWPIGGGDNPGVLGEKVRTANSRGVVVNKNGGRARSNTGICN